MALNEVVKYLGRWRTFFQLRYIPLATLRPRFDKDLAKGMMTALARGARKGWLIGMDLIFESVSRAFMWFWVFGTNLNARFESVRDQLTNLVKVLAVKISFSPQKRIDKLQFLYKQTINFDNLTTQVEILDTSQCEDHCCLQDHIDWADAFVVVYSVCDRVTFEAARRLLERVCLSKGALRVPAILLGNKRDLERGRQVAVDDGHEASLRFRCQFYEVSAAENYVGVSLAFQSLMREARAAQQLRTLPGRRKTGPALSKMIGMVFGRGEKRADRKKRPSLSI